METETAPETRLLVQEEYPPVDKLRIIYSASKVTESTDPILAAVYGYSNRVIAMSYFTQANGEIGTAFFCEMKSDWVVPTPQQTEESIKKLDEL